MRLVFRENQLAADYVAAATKDRYGMPLASMLVIDERGSITGAFVFDRYTGASIEMSLAGKGCITRTAWQAVGDLVYGALGCVRLATTTRKSNKQVRKLAPRLGLQFEGKAKQFYGDEDGLVFALTRDRAVEKGLWRPPEFLAVN